MNVLAIDQGTSATKAIVVCAERGPIGVAEVRVNPKALGDGGVEQDAEELWRSVLSAGRLALERAAEPVAAVGLANQGETVLAWDRASGRALTPALSWQDRRATAECAALAADAARLTDVTGLPLDPYFAGPKMRWLRRHLTRAGVCTTSDAWLIARLTGAYVTDASTASRTMLLDLDAVAWSAATCAAFDVDPATLPAVVGCAEPIGETRVFGAPLPVTGLAVDQQAALFAEACHAPGDAKCTYGTGAFLLATTGSRARRSRAGLAASVAWRLGDATTYCLDGQVYTAGAAVAWLERLGLVASAGELDAVCAPDAGGVRFVPALAGLAAPFWRPEARAAFTGLALASERGHMVRAVLEGVAAQVAWLARAMADDLGLPLAGLRVDGGLTRSRTLMQAQADLLQAPVRVYPSPDATALGVAALARLGAGAVRTAAEAVPPWTPAATYEPQISAAAAEDVLAAWRRAAEAAMAL